MKKITNLPTRNMVQNGDKLILLCYILVQHLLVPNYTIGIWFVHFQKINNCNNVLIIDFPRVVLGK